MNYKKSPKQKNIKIEFKMENDKVYAWAPEYGLTVTGNSREEARSKMRKALKSLSSREGQAVQMA